MAKPEPVIDKSDPSLIGFLRAFWSFNLGRRVLAVWTSVTVLSTALILGLGDLSVPGFVLAFALGWGGWTFLEYHLHRYVMHWTPENERLRKMREFAFPHENHHRLPGSARRTPLRWQHFPVMGAVAFAGILAIALPWEWSAAFTLGGGFGYFVYELVHFATHQWPMTGWLTSRLKRHHMLHHHHDETMNFGVTTTIWDHVFGTVARGPSTMRTAAE